MRGSDERSGDLFSYVLEDRVPAQHPLRLIRRIVNEVLGALDGEFSKIYADTGRPWIPPSGCSARFCCRRFYTIRSETQLMEQLDYNLLYRWFVGLGVDEAVWVPTVFTKNRERLLEAEVAHKFLARTVEPQGGARPAIGRALFGQRHAGCGLGVDEELPRQGWLGRAAVGGPQPRT